MARLFVAVWPPPEVVDAVRRMPRTVPGVRWTTEDQWHITLRFLRSVPEERVPAVQAALDGAAAATFVADAVMGPRVRRVGRVIAIAVDGLDAIAGAVSAATAGFADPPERRPFNGHLTVARFRGRRAPRPEHGWPTLEAEWPVTEIALVQSLLGQGPGGAARYETVSRHSLASPEKSRD